MVAVRMYMKEEAPQEGTKLLMLCCARSAYSFVSNSTVDKSSILQRLVLWIRRQVLLLGPQLTCCFRRQAFGEGDEADYGGLILYLVCSGGPALDNGFLYDWCHYDEPARFLQGRGFKEEDKA
ncbi:hypothetical protein PPTG_21021 [Phytophthora nicotianae INRA-310]|uniref:Uncharacterized protein n=1 Tax=Phytophthora nicotianae (strain INRA-310) TaxID=761204 RepID=W2R658_PHYN3|nr:hypothetical protein PPTG_21021 [Phytophthora nicotianae INRA-310]ETN20862.1 hypothetical protein PPTG_21021 [Phytophthora nicotianae INRA-310]